MMPQEKGSVRSLGKALELLELLNRSRVPMTLQALSQASGYPKSTIHSLLATLRSNAARVVEVINSLPGLATTPVEATYLAWIDCRGLLAARGIANAAAFFEAAGVGLSDGKDFGLPGFVRLNFGCPPQRLEAALERIRHAVMATG